MRFDPSGWGGMPNQGGSQSGYGNMYKGYGNPEMPQQQAGGLGMGMGIMSNSMQPFPGTAYGGYNGMAAGPTGQPLEDGGYLDMGHYAASDGYPLAQNYQLGGWGMGSVLDESTPAWVPASTQELS